MLRPPRWLSVAAASETLVVLVATTLGYILRPDTTEHPERVKTQVVTCDFTSYGAAQITFTIRNEDRVEHNYEVELRVAKGTTELGTSLSYGNWVNPAETATVRALVPLSGQTSDAVCAARAYVHDTHVGHRR